MPTLENWLALRPAGPAGDAVREQVHAFRSEANTLRRAGDLDAAARRDQAAVRAAVAGIARTPAPPQLLEALSALEAWSQRAEDEDLPELDRAAGVVRRLHDQARSALARGDTLAAVDLLAEGAHEANAFAPASVALRALDQAALRLAEEGPKGEDGKRARRLLDNAREAIISGKGDRALRRALYSLQLAEAARHGG